MSKSRGTEVTPLGGNLGDDSREILGVDSSGFQSFKTQTYFLKKQMSE